MSASSVKVIFEYLNHLGEILYIYIYIYIYIYRERGREIKVISDHLRTLAHTMEILVLIRVRKFYVDQQAENKMT